MLYGTSACLSTSTCNMERETVGGGCGGGVRTVQGLLPGLGAFVVRTCSSLRGWSLVSCQRARSVCLTDALHHPVEAPDPKNERGLKLRHRAMNRRPSEFARLRMDHTVRYSKSCPNTREPSTCTTTLPWPGGMMQLSSLSFSILTPLQATRAAPTVTTLALPKL